MGIDISQGGGGGGITIETDPTALKIANNLSDITDQNAAKTNLGLPNGNIDGTLTIGLSTDPTNVVLYPNYEGTGSSSIKLSGNAGFLQLTSESIIFPDGTTQSTAGGGGGGTTSSFSVNGNSVDGFPTTVTLNTNATVGDTTSGLTLGETVVSHNIVSQNTNDHVKIACFDTDYYGYRKVGIEGYTVINEGTYAASIKFGFDAEAGAFGWKVDPALIFPDGTVQNTAYTGGGGGGGGMTYELRLADSICPLIDTVNYQTDNGGGTYYFWCTWASAYSSVPAFLNWYSYNAWGLRSQNAGSGVIEHPVSYIDGSGFVTSTYTFISDNWYIAITSNWTDYQNSLIIYSTV